jgi:hypothetical protein
MRVRQVRCSYYVPGEEESQSTRAAISHGRSSSGRVARPRPRHRGRSSGRERARWAAG